MAADELGGGGADVRVGAVKLGDDDGQRRAAERTKRADHVDRPTLHARIGVVDAPGQVVSKPSVARGSLRKGPNGLEPGLGRLVGKQFTNRRQRVARLPTDTADRRESRGANRGVRVAKGLRQRVGGARRQRANSAQRQDRAAADARRRVFDRFAEQRLDDRPADRRQGLGDRLDRARVPAESTEQHGGGFRADRAEQERRVPRDVLGLGGQDRLQLGRQSYEKRPALDQKVDDRESDLLVGVAKVLLCDGRKRLVVSRPEPDERPDRLGPDLGGVVRRAVEHGALDAIVVGRRPAERLDRASGSWYSCLRMRRPKNRSRPVRWRRAPRGFALDAFAVVAEQRDEVGDGRRGGRADPSERHHGLGPHVLLGRLEQFAERLDGRRRSRRGPGPLGSPGGSSRAAAPCISRSSSGPARGPRGRRRGRAT